MRGAAAITGIGEIPPSPYSDGATQLGWTAEVAHRAIADAGIEPGAVDGLVVQNLADAPFMGAAVAAELIGLRPRFLEMVDLGGASAGVMVARAAMAVAAGLADHVVCVTAVPNERAAPRPAGAPSTAAPGYKARSPQGEWDVPAGATGGVFAFAMLAQVTMAWSGLTQDHLWQVVDNARAAANRNPEALWHGASLLDRDGYDASPLTCTPLRQADQITPCAGAAAVVVSGDGPVRILGVGERHTHRSITYMPDLAVSGGADAARQAFAMAGVGPGDVEVAFLYDAFSPLVPRALEEMGAVPAGQAGVWLDHHDLGPGGPLPVNPNGGLLGCGHAGVAAGMTLVTGLVRQLQGRAGSCQVPRHGLGFVNGTGGEMSTNVALVIGREDR